MFLDFDRVKLLWRVVGIKLTRTSFRWKFESFEFLICRTVLTFRTFSGELTDDERSVLRVRRRQQNMRMPATRSRNRKPPNAAPTIIATDGICMGVFEAPAFAVELFLVDVSLSVLV